MHMGMKLALFTQLALSIDINNHFFWDEEISIIFPYDSDIPNECSNYLHYFNQGIHSLDGRKKIKNIFITS